LTFEKEIQEKNSINVIAETCCLRCVSRWAYWALRPCSFMYSCIYYLWRASQ